MSSAGLSDAVILITRRGLGDGDPALIEKLAVNYLRTLVEMELRPRAVAFYGDGVKLVAHGSPCLEPLRALSAAGVPLIACRTCLDHYGLIDSVAVGEVGTMATIVELQAQALRVISV